MKLSAGLIREVSMNKLMLFIIIGMMAARPSFGQEEARSTELVRNTFNGVRVINTHSSEMQRKGNMDLVFQHRFGKLNSGFYNLFGLDEAWIRIGVDYTPVKNLMLGFGRSSYNKTYDGFLKYRLMSQKEENGAPLTLVYFTNMSVNILKPPAGETIDFVDRLSFTNQVIAARKFSKSFSLQLMPTIIHYNLVEKKETSNDLFAVGVAPKFRLSSKVALTAEYYYRFGTVAHYDTYDPISLGVEIETSGHIFQVHVSNSTAMNVEQLIGNTTGEFFDGDIHIGFNIARSFQIH